VTPLTCSLVGQSHPVAIAAGTRAAALYAAPAAVEEYWCNYGVNPDYVGPLQEAGLRASGFGEDGTIRIVEIADHPFFVATLFLPQKRSAPGRPHPLLAGFARAVSAFSAAPRRS
jgi:CTP synthase (UTP-ammonia lyase)